MYSFLMYASKILRIICLTPTAFALSPHSCRTSLMPAETHTDMQRGVGGGGGERKTIHKQTASGNDEGVIELQSDTSY